MINNYNKNDLKCTKIDHENKNEMAYYKVN